MVGGAAVTTSVHELDDVVVGGGPVVGGAAGTTSLLELDEVVGGGGPVVGGVVACPGGD